jgi:hypothetical protein
MGIQEKLDKAIKDEIGNDPEGRGYTGKTDAEIKQLLTEQYTIETKSFETKEPRIRVIYRKLIEDESKGLDTIEASDISRAKA